MKKTKQELQAENDELRARLEEAEETLNAIRSGEVDALIVSGKEGEQIYTLTGADRTYRLLLESMSEGAVTLNPDGFIIYCNAFFAGLLKIPINRLTGAHLSDFIPQSERQHFQSLLAQGDRGETELRAADKTLVPVYLSVSMLPSEPGQQVICVIVTDLSEQKRDEKIIADGRLSQLIFRQSAEAIIVCDKNGKIILASHAAHALCGQNPLYQPFDKMFPLTLERGKHFTVAQALRLKAAQTSEAELLREDGTPCNLILTSVRLLDENKNNLGCIITLTDITGRKQAEEALKKSERLYRAIGESIDYGVWVCAPDGRNIYASDSFLKLVGLTQEQCSNFGWGDVLHPDDAQRTIAAWKECVRAGGKWDIEHRFKGVDGQWHPVLARGVPVRDEQGNTECWAGINLNINNLKLAQEALRESQDSLNFALETIQTGAWELDLEDNTAHRTLDHDRIFGYNTLLPQWTYEMFLEHVIPEDRGEVDRQFNDAVKTQTDWNFECRIRRADGKIRWILAAGRHRTDKNGKIRRMAGVVQDITERKLAEEGLKERTAELEVANRDLESFSYSVSHDLKSPLLTINGFTAMILKKQGAAFDEDTQNKFNVIRASTQKMGQLIEALLNFSRIGRKAIDAVNLNMAAIVSDVWREAQVNNQERAMTLEIKDMPAASGDRALINQVYVNLIGNAVKFTKHCAAARIEAGSYPDGTENVYYIRDNGAGFDMAYYEKLFGVFQRIHTMQEYEGTGIGLAIVQRIIHKHGGRVWAEGKVGEGAAFYFTLPGGGNSS
jgi:PAS domain S-box-containing protein